MKQLQDILYELYLETIGDMPVSKPVMTIDQIVYCTMDKRDEITELACTRFPFIVQAVVEGGRPENRYVVTWEVTE